MLSIRDIKKKSFLWLPFIIAPLASYQFYGTADPYNTCLQALDYLEK